MTSILIIGSAMLSLFGAWGVVKYGIVLGLADRPTARSSHRVVTAKGGGVGIALGFVFSSILIGVPCWFWGLILTIAFLGLFVDFFEISPLLRLFVEFFVAGLLIGFLSLNSVQPYNTLILIFASVFIVGTANIFNFMDGIDGIAGLSGIVGFSLLAADIALGGGEPSYVWLSVGAASACVGFLPFNLPKAKVFMGDTGSLLLGFLFAGIAFGSARSLSECAVHACCLTPFYLDEFTTMAVRLRARESLVRPHRRHLYQLMANEMEIPHVFVALGYAGAQALVGASIVLTVRFHPIWSLILLPTYFIAFCFLSIYVRRTVGSSPYGRPAKKPQSGPSPL